MDQPAQRKGRMSKSRVGEIIFYLRNRTLHIFVSLALIILMSIFGIKVYTFVYSSNYFKIKNVIIEGSTLIEKDTLTNLKNIPLGKNLLTFDINEFENSFSAMPQIKMSEVIKEFPDSIKVIISERTPIAWTNVNNKILAIDSSAKIFSVTAAHSKMDLPIITGISPSTMKHPEDIQEGLLSAINLIKSLPPGMLSDVSEIHIGKDDTLQIYQVSSRQRIIVSADKEKVEESISRLVKLKSLSLASKQDKASLIDLRYNDIIFKR